MLFIPFKVDLETNRIPFITLLVCLLCLFVFIKQQDSYTQLDRDIDRFCQREYQAPFDIVLEKLTGILDSSSCSSVFATLYLSGDREQTIISMVDNADAFDSFSQEYGKKYIRDILDEKLILFDKLKLKDLTSKLKYDPHSYNVLNMITAAFSHGSWSHLIGNLFFFFAFAASIEIILGSTRYFGIILLLALGTHISYSVAMFSVPNAMPTLGLSGVVMGMIGIFSYMMPNVKIRCFWWFIIFIKVFRIPAWILAFWYIGWDIFELNNADNVSNTNYIAHVSGAVIGFLTGLIFFRKRKVEVRQELDDFLQTKNMVKAVNNK